MVRAKRDRPAANLSLFGVALGIVLTMYGCYSHVRAEGWKERALLAEGLAGALLAQPAPKPRVQSCKPFAGHPWLRDVPRSKS